jgi:hypothetical protein
MISDILIAKVTIDELDLVYELPISLGKELSDTSGTVTSKSVGVQAPTILSYNS